MQVALLAALPLAVASGQAKDTTAKPVMFEVQYRGGNSGVNGGKDGFLQLTDSAVLFIRIDRTPFDTAMIIPIRRITDLSATADRKGPNTIAKWALGYLASGSRDELVMVAYDGATDAEAPVFKTNNNESAELIAKIKFRMRKLGIVKTDSLP